MLDMLPSCWLALVIFIIRWTIILWPRVSLRNTQETLGSGHITRSITCFLLFPMNSSQCWVHAVHSLDSCESTMATWEGLRHHGASDCTSSMFPLPSKISVTIHQLPWLTAKHFFQGRFLIEVSFHAKGHQAITQLAFQKNKDTWSLMGEVILPPPEM